VPCVSSQTNFPPVGKFAEKLLLRKATGLYPERRECDKANRRLTGLPAEANRPRRFGAGAILSERRPNGSRFNKPVIGKFSAILFNTLISKEEDYVATP
jgi:hypothetical protein